MRSVMPIFETLTEHITDLPKMNWVCSKQLGAMFCFFCPE